MGRLEKQIIAVALALVFILIIGVVFADGLRPVAPTRTTPTQYPDAVDSQPSPELRIEAPKTNDAVSVEFSDDSEPSIPPQTEDISSEHGFSTPQVPTPTQAPTATAVDLQPEPTPAVHVAQTVPETIVYTVQEGDVFSTIVYSHLGSIRRQREVLVLNPRLDPDVLMPGDEIILPNPMIQVKPTSVAPSTEVVTPPGVRTHTVQANESLWKLAQHYYNNGSPKFRQRIVDANEQLSDVDDFLDIDMVLVIPE